MHGIVINLEPLIFRLGSFELRWYSLAILAGVAAAVFIAAYRGQRKGIPRDEFYAMLPWVLLGGILGARLVHIIDRWGYYASHPALILQIQQGGLAIWGGLAGGGLALVLYARNRHLPMWRLLDAVTIGLLAAQIIGRLGCIVNGDAYGGITSLPWAFIYVNPDAMIPANLLGVPTHPYPVYEMLWNGLVLWYLLTVGRRFTRDGQLFLSYLAFYSLGRFALTFVRQEDITLWGLQQAQVLAVMIMMASVALFIYRSRRDKPHLAAGSPASAA